MLAIALFALSISAQNHYLLADLSLRLRILRACQPGTMYEQLLPSADA
jgi:hypothetical protein